MMKNSANHSLWPRMPGQILLVALFLMTGCTTLQEDFDRPLGPSFQASNFFRIDSLPEELHRVGLLPLHLPEGWSHLDTRELNAIFLAEVTRQGRFEVIPVEPAYLQHHFGQRSFTPTRELPYAFPEKLRQDLGVDGLLFVDITHYSPYQPVAMGIRAKLLEVSGTRIIWSFDTLFDAGEPSVAAAARRFQQRTGRSAYPLDHSKAILQSPVRFARYAAFSTFETIPLRIP